MTQFDTHRELQIRNRPDGRFILYNKCDICVWEKPATSEPDPVRSNHNSPHDRNNGIIGIIVRLSKRSGTNSTTNLQSPIVRCLGIDNVRVRFANESNHILRNDGCRIRRHGSSNLSHESMKFYLLSRSNVNQNAKILTQWGELSGSKLRWDSGPSEWDAHGNDNGWSLEQWTQATCRWRLKSQPMNRQYFAVRK